MRFGKYLRVALFACLLLIGTVVLYDRFERAEREFQNDADVRRLEHLIYYGRLIEEFRAKQGIYPLAVKSDETIHVLIALPSQLGIENDVPTYSHSFLPAGRFFDELENGLGRRIDEYYDPQHFRSGRAHSYIYTVDKGEYSFAVHIKEPFRFAEPLSPGFFRVEIASLTNPSKAFPQTLNELMERDDFQTALTRPIAKKEFFDDREKPYLRVSREH